MGHTEVEFMEDILTVTISTVLFLVAHGSDKALAVEPGKGEDLS